MKIATNRLRTQRMLPEVYSDESRDFQIFTKLMDSVSNSCDFNIKSMQYVSDPKQIKSNLLTLLADRQGITSEDAKTLTDDEVRMILRCLPELIKNKGTEKALNCLVNMYFKLYHISGDYTLSVKNNSAVIQDITLQDRTIILGLETLAQSTKMLTIIAKYILPPGYSFFVYFYSKLNQSSKDLHDDGMATLLFRSYNLDSMVSQEIPDFIENNLYLIGDPQAAHDWYITSTFRGDTITDVFEVPKMTTSVIVKVNGQVIYPPQYTYDHESQTVTFASPPTYGDLITIACSALAGTDQVISAVDASELSGYATRLGNDNFIGFHTNTYLTGDKATEGSFAYKYVNATAYSAETTYQHGDIAIWGTGSSAVHKIYVTEFPAHMNVPVDSTWIKEHSYWRSLKHSEITNSTLAIADDSNITTVTNTNEGTYYQYRTTGEIYILSDNATAGEPPVWHKLKFRGSYRNQAKPTEDVQDYDYYCEIETETPKLHRVIGGVHSDYTLESRGFIHEDSDIPTIAGEDNQLVYNVNKSTYYAHLEGSWRACIERHTFSGQLPVNYESFSDMSVYWVRGGRYKIKYGTTEVAGENVDNWIEYSEPIFLLKLIQRRDDVERNDE